MLLYIPIAASFELYIAASFASLRHLNSIFVCNIRLVSRSVLIRIAFLLPQIILRNRVNWIFLAQ